MQVSALAGIIDEHYEKTRVEHAYSCRKCGALVWNLGLHLDFHGIVPKGWGRVGGEFSQSKGLGDPNYDFSVEKDREGKPFWEKRVERTDCTECGLSYAYCSGELAANYGACCPSCDRGNTHKGS